jgi:RNase P/RNase MRP subunit p30
VRFLQGHAVIKDGRDMVAMMRRPDVKIILTAYAMSWVEVWLKEAGESVRAEIMIPEDAPSMWAPELRSTHGTDGADADTGTV